MSSSPAALSSHSAGRVLITGGAGFVGSQLALTLVQQGCSVLLLDDLSYGQVDNLLHQGRTFAQLVVKDIRDVTTAPLYEGVDCVVHLAGIAALPACQLDPRLAYDVNVSGTAAVLEFARRAGVRRVLFSSTSAVYEKTAAGADGKMTEDLEVQPDLVYACTKAAAEDVCRSFAKNYKMDVIICRFFNLFGPHQDIQRTSPPFTSYVARELAFGRAPILFNQTDARRDYVHVADVIDLLIRMMQSNKRRYAADVFNIASGHGHSVGELYKIFQEVSGKSSITAVYDDPSKFWDKYPALFSGSHPLSRERIVAEVYKNAVGDSSKACNEFGWAPKQDLRAGINGVYQSALTRLNIKQ